MKFERNKSEGKTGLRVLLKFPKNVIEEPIISTTILRTHAIFNILRAEVTPERGELVGEIIGDAAKVNCFLQILKEKKVYVRELKHAIEITKDCVDCGLCIGVCPTNALVTTPNDSVKLKPEKCVLCKACVEVCPVKAIKLFV